MTLTLSQRNTHSSPRLPCNSLCSPLHPLLGKSDLFVLAALKWSSPTNFPRSSPSSSLGCVPKRGWLRLSLVCSPVGTWSFASAGVRLAALGCAGWTFGRQREFCKWGACSPGISLSRRRTCSCGASLTDYGTLGAELSAENAHRDAQLPLSC